MSRPIRRRRITAIAACATTGKKSYRRRDAAYVARMNRRRDHEPWGEIPLLELRPVAHRAPPVPSRCRLASRRLLSFQHRRDRPLHGDVDGPAIRLVLLRVAEWRTTRRWLRDADRLGRAREALR